MKNIVVIDDNEAVLLLVKRALEKDYKIHSFSSSLEGLEFIRNNFPDLIITDLEMPDIHGHELCSQLKGNESTANIPILVISSKTGSPSRTLAYQLGAINYLEKPFELNELKHLVSSILKQTFDEKTLSLLEYQDLILDPKNFYCSHEEGDYQLTHSETIILEALLKNPEETVTRETLALKLSLKKEKISFRTVDTHISSIRKKIKFSKTTITSIYGIGYRLQKLKKAA